MLNLNTNNFEEHAVQLEQHGVSFWDLCGWPQPNSIELHLQEALLTESDRWQLSTKLLQSGLLANTLHTLELCLSAEVRLETVLPCLTHAGTSVGLLQGLRVLRLGPQVRSCGLVEEQLPLSQVHAFLDGFPKLEELSTGCILVQNDRPSTHADGSHLGKQRHQSRGRHDSLKTLCMFPGCAQALSSLLSRCSDSFTDLKLFNTADAILLPVIPKLCPHLRSLAYDGQSRPDTGQDGYSDWEDFFAQMPDLTSLEVSGIELPHAVYFAVTTHCRKLQIIKDYNNSTPLPTESSQEPSVLRSICPFQYLVSLELTQVHLVADTFNNSLRNAIRLMTKLKVLTVTGAGLTRHAILHDRIYKYGWAAREDHPSQREMYDYPIERLTMYTFAEELSDFELKEWVRVMPRLTSMELASGQGYNWTSIASIRMGTIPPMVSNPHGYCE
ncbi:hypothetical protein BGZ68_000914 [Mortierella alpina]|nr:hypothetical protein BGZ68_000914 [Mortierella alpina]